MSTFQPFMKLPPELRHQIWIGALSDCIRPTAFLYKTKCWELSVVQDPLEERLRFRHNELDHVPLKTPILSVCHESRGIALIWLYKQKDVRIQGNEKLTTKKDNRLAISTAFDPKRDVLYLPQKVFWHFCRDPFCLLDELADDGLYVEPENPVRKLAIHAETLDMVVGLENEDMHALCHIIEEWFDSIDYIYMVVNLNVETQFCSQDDRLRSRWTFDMLPAEQDCQEPRQKASYKKAKEVEEAIKDLVVSESFCQRLTVQPAEMRRL